jgi:hypothetical protein
MVKVSFMVFFSLFFSSAITLGKFSKKDIGFAYSFALLKCVFISFESIPQGYGNLIILP